jgi:hypothetical protein
MNRKEREIANYLKRALTKDMCDAVLESVQDHRILAAHFCHLFNLDPERMAHILYRVANPKSRAEEIIAINKNTGCSRDYRCTVCGASGFGSFCTKWPMTVQSKDAIINHRNYEIKKINRIKELVG